MWNFNYGHCKIHNFNRELKKIIDTYTATQENDLSKCQLSPDLDPMNSVQTILDPIQAFANGPNRLNEQNQQNQNQNYRRKRRRRNLSNHIDDQKPGKEHLWPLPVFDILNLVPSSSSSSSFFGSTSSQTYFTPNPNKTSQIHHAHTSNGNDRKSNRFTQSNDSDSAANVYWKVVGNITSDNATLNTLTFISGNLGDSTMGPGPSSKHNFR